MLEQILIHAVFIIAVTYLARWFYRNMLRSGERGSCPTCDSCETKDMAAAKTEEQSSPSS